MNITQKTFLTRKASKQYGLSVVELLISMVISMAVVAGAVEMVVSSKRSYLDQDEVTFIQTNARYALDILAKDIRMAGYWGCSARDTVQVANALNNDSGGYISTFGLNGYDGSANTDSFPADFKSDAKVGTDAILIRRASNDAELSVKEHNSVSALITVWGEHNYAQGSTLVISDSSCRNVGLFQVSGVAGSPSNQIFHMLTGTNNCTSVIKGNFKCEASCNVSTCGGANSTSGAYSAGSKVMGFVGHAYYVADSSLLPGMPALKRRAINIDGTPSIDEEEIAVGVEDMELLYGIDTVGDGSVEEYRSADNMDVNGDGFVNQEDWNMVSNVKISLVFRSQNPVLTSAESRTLAGVTYNDRYMRQLVNSTVKIRNRG